MFAFTKEKFSNALRKKRSFKENGRKVKDSQEHNYVQNQRFQVDWEVPETNEITTNIDFFKELFEGHQESLWR